jgi:hypothetical protein
LPRPTSGEDAIAFARTGIACLTAAAKMHPGASQCWTLAPASALPVQKVREIKLANFERLVTECHSRWQPDRMRPSYLNTSKRGPATIGVAAISIAINHWLGLGLQGNPGICEKHCG